MNVELASPPDFVPVRSDWNERSPFIRQVGAAFFHHFDLYAQAVAKIVRGHHQDNQDVRAMARLGLIAAAELRQYFAIIEPDLYRYPALDPVSVRRAVTAFADSLGTAR
ncbi:MAG: hypothetical protein JO104_04660 [Candidatus Eremiobacteraeota bacterium]|nr:hypothetical protein [Candidatus Eremiobacteraeota bacterium]